MNCEAQSVERVICVDIEITKNYDRASIGKNSSEPKRRSSRNEGSDCSHRLSAIKKDGRWYSLVTWYSKLGALGTRASQWIGVGSE